MALHGDTWQSAKSPRHDATGLIIPVTKLLYRQTDTHTLSLMSVSALLDPTGPDSGNCKYIGPGLQGDFRSRQHLRCTMKPPK